MSHTLPTRRVPDRLLVALVFAVAGFSLRASADPLHLSLREYVLTSWTHNDGVPLTSINRILQTSDGYLWIFMRDELLRFDGMRFVRPSTPCTERIQSQTPAVDGGFWAVCGEKLIRRMPDGRFLMVAQMPSRSPQHTLFGDREGRVWILGPTIRYLNSDGSEGRTFDSPRARLLFTAAQDSDGTIWATDRENLFQLHGDRVEFVQKLEGARCLTASRKGGVFASSGSADTNIWQLRKGVRAELVAHFPGLNVSGPPAGCMREAKDGGLWLATLRNLVALVHGNRVETLADTGQWERVVTEVFIDRDGAIWAGATSGLHRFRQPTVQLLRWPAEHGQPRFVFVDSRQDLWTGHSMGTSRWSLTDDTKHRLMFSGDYEAIGEDETGTVWLSKNHDTIGYIADGRFVAVSDATGRPVVEVNAFTKDHRGHLWALSRGVGVYQVTPGPPRLVTRSPLALHRFLVSEHSGIWISLEDGGLEQHFNGRTYRIANPNPARHTFSALTMMEDGDSVWVGSLAGLDRFRNGARTTWTREHGLPADGSVKAMIRDRSQQLWIMTGGGLLRVPRAQLDATPDGHPRPLQFARIGSLDGLVPHPGNLRSSPAATADRNGRLYFSTTDTVATVDPDHVTESFMIPPVAIESVIIDDASIDLMATASFVEPSRLQFQYTTLNLRTPEYARFRYQLDGYDPAWVEAGTERRATYGTLSPGTYRFRVIGAGSEGVWNETAASFTFQIVPVFWRTGWFRLTVAAIGALLVGGLFQLRIRQVTRQFNLGLEARVGERTRIARELHDTLLQTFQGVLIHFKAATKLLPQRPDEAKQRIETILEEATRGVTDGRDAIQALRRPAGPSDDLSETLSLLAAQLAADADPSCTATLRVNVEGAPRALRPIVRDDLYRIASEAMRNAMRHAQARLIQVDVHYDRRRLRLRIVDDGLGIDPAILDRGGVSGHWGLPGMRERAEVIGCTLDVRSRPGSGTAIELSLPSSKAYAVNRERFRYWRRPSGTGS